MQHHITVVLLEPQFAGNIGASARALKTMGINDLALVNPQQYPSDEARWRAAGAKDILSTAKVYPSLDKAIAECELVVATSARRRKLSIPSSAAHQWAQGLSQVPATKMAIVFGRENSGLSQEELLKCQQHIYIPSAANYPVLNLAASVQIVCYELFRNNITSTARAADLSDHYSWSTAPHEKLASSQELQFFYQHLEKLLVLVDFLNPKQPFHVMPKLKRLFQRSMLRKDEIQILRGFLKYCEQKISK